MSCIRNLPSRRHAWLLVVPLLFGACSGPAPSPQPAIPSASTPVTTATAEPAAPSTPAVSPTPFQPSPTPPLAARVNGGGITRQALEAEVARLAVAANREATDEDLQRVLDSLVDGLLLAQAAKEEGFQTDEAQLQARLDALQAGMGGPEQWQAWLAAQGYDEASFRSDLAQASAAAWMRDKITAAVPETAEQVLARQVLVGSRQEADEIVARLRAGESFTSLAEEYDPVAGGELGWFPRGYLIEPGLDEAVFALQPGEWTGPLETTLGFHLIQVIEREAERPLTPDARQTWQQAALREWLAARRDSAQIEILKP